MTSWVSEYITSAVECLTMPIVLLLHGQKLTFIWKWHSSKDRHEQHTICVFFFLFFWGPQYPRSGTGNTLQDGLVWQSSAWKLSWGEALQQPGWDKAAYPQGHSNVMVCAANLLLAIHWVWISSMGENHFDFRSLANWLLQCLSTLKTGVRSSKTQRYPQQRWPLSI